MDTATLVCPFCGGKQQVEIPKDKCLPMYKCEHCGRLITVPEGSDNCCVICEYSDKKCPVSGK